MGLISRVSSRTYRNFFIMAENHPFLEMLTGMGFERQKCINVMNRVGLDANIEQLVIELTSEPDIPKTESKPEPETTTTSTETPSTSSSSAAAAAQNRASNPQPG